jgi:sugar phosphate isomerase/epimerase
MKGFNVMDVRIGACDWALPGAGLNAPRIAAEFGLEALSLKIGLYENDYPITHEKMQKYYLNDQQKYGIDYCALALNDFDNIPMHARMETPEYLKVSSILDKSVRTVVAMHIPVIQVPGFAASEIKNDEDREYAATRFRYLCDKASEYGVKVASENLLKPEEFKVLYEMVDRKNFGAYYDSQNYKVFRGYDQLEILDGLFPYMVNQLHVKDGKGVMSGALLGVGDSDFYGTMRILEEKSFKGYILLENYYDQLPLRLEDGGPYSLLEKDINILKKACGNFTK